MKDATFIIESEEGRLQVSVFGYTDDLDGDEPDHVDASIVVERPGRFRLQLDPDDYFSATELSELGDWLNCVWASAMGLRQLPRDFAVRDGHLVMKAGRCELDRFAVTVTAANDFGAQASIALTLTPEAVERAVNDVRRVSSRYPRRAGDPGYEAPTW